MTIRRRADLTGRLVRRYKRFFADVRTADGRELTVHCPNPGSMRGCLAIGAAVRCSTSADPRRKLAHTLEMIRLGRVWVGLHTLRANQLAAEVLRRGFIEGLAGYPQIRNEVRVGERTRLDFLLQGRADDPRPVYLEVKSVTMAEGVEARFPDSVTVRGRRHALELATLVERGARAALLFVVQRADCRRVAPADDIDPDYGRALREAARGGVEMFALGARVGPSSIRAERELPVCL